jgi:hypothetical protein
MPAIWDGDLPAAPPARPSHRDHDVTAPEAGSTANTIRAVQAAHPQHCAPTATAAGNRETPQPSWPSAPFRREPSHPAPASPQAHEPQPKAERPAAAAHEPRTAADATADAPDTDDRTPGADPRRWPAPNPSIRQEGVLPTGQARDTPGTATQTKVDNPSPRARDAAPSADWRDHIISAAREPWQSSRSLPDNPALHRSPDARQPDPGFEASE